MITEIVSFPLPAGTTREEALVLYRSTAGKCSMNEDLIRKYYHFDIERSLGGGIYIWPSRELAAKWHGDDYRKTINEVYGAYPSISVFDLLIDVDPISHTVNEAVVD